MFQPSGPRDPGCARCLTPGISLEGCRGSPQPAVLEAEGGAGSYPGLLPRRRLGPRAGRGEGALGSAGAVPPLTRGGARRPHPPAPSPAAPRARPSARLLPGPAGAGAASRLGRHSAPRALRAAAGAAEGTRFGGGSGSGARRPRRMRRRLAEPGAAAAAGE